MAKSMKISNNFAIREAKDAHDKSMVHTPAHLHANQDSEFVCKANGVRVQERPLIDPKNATKRIIIAMASSITFPPRHARHLVVMALESAHAVMGNSFANPPKHPPKFAMEKTTIVMAQLT